jgi:hypothetical protein
MEKAVEATLTSDDDVLVKHRARTANKDGWKVQTWLEASLFRESAPIHVWFRTFPPASIDSAPKATAHLKLLQQDKTVVQERTIALRLKDCAKMEPRREIENESDGIANFPPKERCWEGAAAYAFSGPAKPVAAGTYLVIVEIAVENGPKIEFAPASIEIRKRLTGPNN